jgi:hypothetical protein
MRKLLLLAMAAAAAAPVALVNAQNPAPGADEIVRRSVAVLKHDWQEAPAYSFIEHDLVIKNGKRSVRKSAVVMIDGSPYWMLLEENDKPLTANGLRQERVKLEREVQVRSRQSESERRKRVAEYEKGRKQDHALLMEMADAFRFKLVGEEEMRGHHVYVLDATPRPGYQPKSLETRVLTGMRGRLWVERGTYQWVKVEADVTRPVAYGLFIAKVQPGTRFTLEQSPVTGDIWLPSRFTMNVNASVLWWSRTSSEDEYFFAYRRANQSDLLAGLPIPSAH